MSLLAVRGAPDQRAVLSDIWSRNHLPTSPVPSPRWSVSEDIRVGEELPILWLNCGLIETRWVHWGSRDGMKRSGSIDGEKGRYARRCLVPAAAVEIVNEDRLWRLKPQGAEFFFIAGVWRPINSYSCEPYTVELMTTGPTLEQKRLISQSIVTVAGNRVEEWFRSTAEPSWMQRPGAGVPISLTEIGKA